MDLVTCIFVSLVTYWAGYVSGGATMRRLLWTDASYRLGVRREVPCDGYNCRWYRRGE
jgi:hypothetical protein